MKFIREAYDKCSWEKPLVWSGKCTSTLNKWVEFQHAEETETHTMQLEGPKPAAKG